MKRKETPMQRMKHIVVILAVAVGGFLAMVGTAFASVPNNNSVPVVSGSTTVGSTLTTTNGSWTGSPAPTFTYQWQDCTVPNASCTDITGATSMTYVLQTSDVGLYVRSKVFGTNSNGSANAKSVTTAAITGSGGGGGTQTTGCFASPGACGYPDPAYGNVGSPASCSSLPTFVPTDLPSADYYYSGSGNVVSITANNVTISGYNDTSYEFNLDGVSGTTFNDDCVSVSGDSGNDNSINASSNGTSYGSHTTVTNSTLTGSGCSVATAKTAVCTGSGVVQQLAAGGSNSLYNNDIFVGAVEDVGMGSGSTLENSYVVANGYQSGGHTEDTFSFATNSNMTFKHNTLLNPFDQTADIFIGDASGACPGSNNSATSNLMAGGGFTIYECAGASSDPGGFTFSGNDIARCDGTPVTYQPNANDGTTCGTTAPSSSTDYTAFGAGADTFGYWPLGGYFAVADVATCTGWSGNTWDDTGATIACP